MAGTGAEYEPEDALDTRELLQAITFVVLLLASVVWLVIGFQNQNPVVLSVWVCVGGFSAFMLARVWAVGPVVDS